MVRIAVVFYNDHWRDSFANVLEQVSAPLARWFQRKEEEDWSDYSDDEDAPPRVPKPTEELVDAGDGKQFPFYSKPASLQFADLEIWLVYAESKNWDYAEALDVLTGGVKDKLHMVCDNVTVIYQSDAYECIYPRLNGRSVRTCTHWHEFASYIPSTHRRTEVMNKWATVWNAFVDPNIRKRA